MPTFGMNPLVVDYNPWLAAAIGLAARIFLPGLAWAWVLPDAGANGRGAWHARLRAGALAAFIGLIVSVGVVIALGESGRYLPAYEWATLLGITGLGAGLGLWRARTRLLGQLRKAVPSALLFFVAAAGIMLFPGQGEWLVGGWDPGTYVDQGVFVSRNGTFRPGPDPLLSTLRPSEWDVFVPRTLNFAEGLPVFPVDPDTRRFEFFFFRPMPAFVALADRCGGLRAAVRANAFLGALVLLAAASVFWIWFGRREHRLFALALFAAQPIWLYHWHFPTSELLQQALWFGMFVVAAERTRSRGGGALTAMGCFALTATHISAVLFLGLFLLVMAWSDLERDDRRQVVRERMWQIAAILAGVALDLWTSPTTVERLGFVLPKLSILAGLFAVLALAVDLGAPRDGANRHAVGLLAGGLSVVFTVLGAAGLVGLAGLAPGRMSWLHHNMTAILPYLTPGLVLLAVAGVWIFAARNEDVARDAKAALFLMLGVTLASLLDSAIAALYPWATRRYLVFTVPLLAAGAGYVLARLAVGPRRWMPAAAIVVFVAVLAGFWPWTRAAWTRTEYDGLSAQLAAVAAQVGPKDVVVADRFCYGVPLRFVYGLPVLNGERLTELTGRSAMERAVGVLARLHEAGWRIRFLTSSDEGIGVFPFRLAGLTWDWQSKAFCLQEIEHDPHVADYRVRELNRRFTLHTWDPAQGGLVFASPVGVWRVDIGDPNDAAYLAAGFHEREQVSDAGSTATVRWTAGTGIIEFLGEAPAGGRVVVDVVDRHVPPDLTGAGTSLAWNGELLQLLSVSTPREGWRRIEARVPPDSTGLVHRLRISSPVWSPRERLGANDGRLLGVMVDAVEVHPAAAGNNPQFRERR
jgi:hypothetical protein